MYEQPCDIRVIAVASGAHEILLLTAMDTAIVRTTLKRAITSTRRRCPCSRQYATGQDSHQDPIRAAPPIAFSSNRDQFSRQRPRAEFVRGNERRAPLLDRIRIIPASPSYFTATPRYTDDLLHLLSLSRKYLLLPKVASAEAPRVAWKTLEQYRTELGEPVRQKGYGQLVVQLKRLNLIHPSLMPMEVETALTRYKRRVQPNLNLPKPIVVDAQGRTRAVGRRKSSQAVVVLVEGEGECLVNGRSLSEYFGRLTDRESAMFPLKATGRLDKYNIWAIAKGGGTTGQAEAITLGLAKALMAHEPDLKPALRKGEPDQPRYHTKALC